MPVPLMNMTTESPDAQGALSRNKQGYFHVRFQMSILPNSLYSLTSRSEPALLQTIGSMQYAFAHQQPEGDFQLAIPPSLAHLGSPKPGDLASGISFFASALGTALVAIDNDNWVKDKPQFVSAIAEIKLKSRAMMNWLKLRKDTLMIMDQRAANRLFFNAKAFYTFGIVLNDEELVAIGEEYIRTALERQSSTGYFIENDGYDVSYNGVSLLIGLQLFSCMPAGGLKDSLSKALARTALWQLSYIRNNGELDITGSTRIYPGGEMFLGEEKKPPVKDIVLAFHLVNLLSNDERFKRSAKSLMDFYR